MLRVITINLNGIRSAWGKGFGAWLRRQNADIVFLQEVRAHAAQMRAEMLSPPGYFGFFHAAQKPGYSGVGVYCRRRPNRVLRRTGIATLDDEGRFLELDFGNLRAACLYMPSGSSGDARQQVKYAVMDKLYPRLRRAARQGGRRLLCGDLNIAHTEKDIRNWRGNLKNSGFLPEERRWLTRLFDDGGWRDVFRQMCGRDGVYTWWSNRGRARENNVGWRIDYQLATPELAAAARKWRIHTARRFSDHAPFLVDYDTDF